MNILSAGWSAALEAAAKQLHSSSVGFSKIDIEHIEGMLRDPELKWPGEE